MFQDRIQQIAIYPLFISMVLLAASLVAPYALVHGQGPQLPGTLPNIGPPSTGFQPGPGGPTAPNPNPGTTNPGAQLPGAQAGQAGAGPGGGNQTFRDFIANIIVHIQLAVPLVFLAAFFVFLVGGALFIFNAGNEQSVQQGKTLLFWGVIVLFLMASIWSIIKLIQLSFGL